MEEVATVSNRLEGFIESLCSSILRNTGILSDSDARLQIAAGFVWEDSGTEDRIRLLSYMLADTSVPLSYILNTWATPEEFDRIMQFVMGAVIRHPDRYSQPTPSASTGVVVVADVLQALVDEATGVDHPDTPIPAPVVPVPRKRAVKPKPVAVVPTVEESPIPPVQVDMSSAGENGEVSFLVPEPEIPAEAILDPNGVTYPEDDISAMFRAFAEEPTKVFPPEEADEAAASEGDGDSGAISVDNIEDLFT